MKDGAPVDAYRERAIRECAHYVSQEAADAMAECFDLIAQFHAEPVTPPVPKPFFTPPGMTVADRYCLNCRGYRFTHEDHGFDHTMGTVRCRRCAGKGYLA